MTLVVLVVAGGGGTWVSEVDSGGPEITGVEVGGGTTGVVVGLVTTLVMYEVVDVVTGHVVV